MGRGTGLEPIWRSFEYKKTQKHKYTNKILKHTNLQIEINMDYLKVHEGPTLIRMANKEPSKLKAGIFFSDEPGFYKEGEFGLRLETILRCVAKKLCNG